MALPKIRKEFGERANPDSAIFLLHGLKTDHGAMIPAAQQMAEALPNSLILLPDAPQPVKVREKDEKWIRKHYPNFSPDKARGWFNLGKLPPLSAMFNLHRALSDVNYMIDKTLDEHRLDDRNLFIAGFSQGGTMALYSAFNRKATCAGAICMGGPFVGMTRTLSHPDILITVGENDRLFMDKNSKFPQFPESIEKLKKTKSNVEYGVIAGLDHDVNEETVTRAIQFIQKRHPIF